RRRSHTRSTTPWIDSRFRGEPVRARIAPGTLTSPGGGDHGRASPYSRRHRAIGACETGAFERGARSGFLDPAAASVKQGLWRRRSLMQRWTKGWGSLMAVLAALMASPAGAQELAPDRPREVPSSSTPFADTMETARGMAMGLGARASASSTSGLAYHEIGRASGRGEVVA